MANPQLYRVMRATRALLTELDELDQDAAAELDIDLDELRDALDSIVESVAATERR